MTRRGEDEFDWPRIEPDRDDRLARVRTVLDQFEDHRSELIDAAVTDTALPKAHLAGEFEAAFEAVSNLERLHRRADHRDAKLGSWYDVEYRHVGKGSVVVFTPWNTPLLSMLFLPVLSYTAGNETVVKPSSKMDRLGEQVSSLYADLPIMFEFASGRVVSERLDGSTVDFVYYMGTREVGESIADGFGKEFFGEYEANNVAIVDSCDPSYPKLVVENVVDKNGMDCDNLRGVFVREGLESWFVETVRAELDESTVGDPADKETDLSEIHAPDGVNLNLNPEWEAMTEPSLGPSLWVRSYTNTGALETTLSRFFDESGYGLSTVVLSANRADELADFLAAETPTTRVCVDRQSMEFTPHAPWGGRGLTADGGAIPWVEKFTDRVVVESATEGER